MEIKKATLDDFEEVLELKLKLKEFERELNKNLPSLSQVKQYYEKYLRKYLSSENSAVFIALEENKPVAMISAKIYQALPTQKSEIRGYLSNLYVEEEFRRHGIGKKLMEKAIEWIKSKNAKTVRGEIYKENILSLNLARSLGFIEYSIKIFKDL